VSDTKVFEQARPRLLGLAYRITGSLADAEDAVQDTWLAWSAQQQSADPNEMIHNPTAWLTTVCTRRCLDMLRSAHRSRVDYVGAWLPEPVQTVAEQELTQELATTLTTAFLLMLERLSPKERAAYLLYEIFDNSYQDIARTLNLTESYCRKLVSRAKIAVEQSKVRHQTTADKQQQFISAFEAAITEGETGALSALLADDVRLSADGGGKVATIREVLSGRDDVLSFIHKKLSQYWTGYQWQLRTLNGTCGVILTDGEAVVATLSFAYDENDKANNIFIVRNPDKIKNLAIVSMV